MAVTWSPTHIGANIGLTNGNLTATYNSTGARPSVFTTDGVSSGKYYWEIVCTDGSGAGFTAGSSGVGMGGTGSITTALGSSTDQSAIAYYGVVPDDGITDGIWWNSVQQVVVGVPASYPVTFCCALDATGRLFWIRVGTAGNWNGSGTANPATGVGGYSLPSQVVTPFVPAARLSGNGDFVDGKFASASWAGTAPSGFGPLPDTLMGQVCL